MLKCWGETPSHLCSGSSELPEHFLRETVSPWFGPDGATRSRPPTCSHDTCGATSSLGLVRVPACRQPVPTLAAPAMPGHVVPYDEVLGVGFQVRACMARWALLSGPMGREGVTVEGPQRTVVTAATAGGGRLYSWPVEAKKH